MKRRKKQLWALILFVAALFFTLPVAAQVTIGSEQIPEKNALLDLRENTTDSLSSKGLLLPRVELASTTDTTPLDAHVKGMFVYNTATAGDVTPGIYYNDGTKWMKVGEDQKKWFYMPSFNLPVTTTVGEEAHFDLYAEYAKQFTASGNSQFVSSNTGAANVEAPYAADELEYYVTAYSSGVVQINSISSTGDMTYTMLTADIPEGSFINVIFKVK